MNDFGTFFSDNLFLFLALFTVVTALIMSEFQRKMGVKTISPSEATHYINREGALVLDIRDKPDFKKGHIVNAKNISRSQLDSRIGELEKFKSKPIIVCCNTGQQAISASKTLHKQGFESIYRLTGGMQAWRDENMPVVKK